MSIKFIPLHVLRNTTTDNGEPTTIVHFRVVPATRILDVNATTGKVILHREYPTSTKEEVVYVAPESMEDLVNTLLEVPVS